MRESKIPAVHKQKVRGVQTRGKTSASRCYASSAATVSNKITVLSALFSKITGDYWCAANAVRRARPIPSLSPTPWVQGGDNSGAVWRREMKSHAVCSLFFHVKEKHFPVTLTKQRGSHLRPSCLANRPMLSEGTWLGVFVLDSF